GQAYKASDLSAFLDHSNLPQVASDYLAKLWDHIDGHTTDKQAVAGARKALPLLARHPLAIYASNVTINPDGTPNADVAMICDAGSDAAELQSELQSTTENNPHLHVVTQGSFVIVGVDDSAKKVDGPTLANQPGFVATMKSLQPS